MKLANIFILILSTHPSFNALLESCKIVSCSTYSSREINDTQDTTKIKSIDHLTDSLIKATDHFEKISIYQVTGDCYGDEVLFYDSNYNLVMSQGQLGCGSEETKYLIIQSVDELIYFQSIEIGDGLPMNKFDVYFEKGNPFHGEQIDYNIDWEKYLLIDSLTSVPKGIELLDLAKSATDITKYFDELLLKINEIDSPRYKNGQVRLYFPDQQLDEDKYYLIDSIFYQSIKSDL